MKKERVKYAFSQVKQNPTLFFKKIYELATFLITFFQFKKFLLICYSRVREDYLITVAT